MKTMKKPVKAIEPSGHWVIFFFKLLGWTGETTFHSPALVVPTHSLQHLQYLVRKPFKTHGKTHKLPISSNLQLSPSRRVIIGVKTFWPVTSSFSVNIPLLAREVNKTQQYSSCTETADTSTSTPPHRPAETPPCVEDRAWRT